MDITYLNAGRTLTVPLEPSPKDLPAFTEGPCQSHASLTCTETDPQMGFLRILPESMLPGQERTQLIQCLDCYEASGDAYQRKLHHYVTDQGE